jgi:flotillin
VRRSAVAEAVEREGAAEATAILARGRAEAMQAKAEAFARYGEAAKPVGTRGDVRPQVLQAVRL